MAENGILAATNGDVEMKEEAQYEPPPGVAQAQDLTDPQPPPQAEHTSVPAAAGNLIATESASLTASAPSPVPARATSIPPAAAKPEKPVAHGGPTRQYLNQNVTPHLLEAMKYLASYEPEKPLLWLSDFLRDRSKEVEGP